MQLHPRHVPYRKAVNELLAWLADWETRHDLTEPEYLVALTEAVQQRLQSIVKSEREQEGQTP